MMIFTPIPLSWKSDLNDLLTNYGVPLFVFLMLIGVSIGVVANIDKLRAQDWGSKQEGMFSILWYLLFTFLAVAALGFILNRLASWSPSI